MKKKVLGLVLSVAIVGILLYGCGSSGTDSETAVTEDSKSTGDGTADAESTNSTVSADSDITIAYITPSTTTPFWNWIEDGVQAQADAEGYTLEVYDSANDSATQLKNAQNAITAQVDAIVISPTDSASCPAVLEEAEAAGIPVVICDVGTDSGNYLTMVSTPNYDGAYEVGKYLVEYLQENNLSGSIGEITVQLSRINGQNRTQGFADALAEGGFEVNTILESSAFTMEEADSQTRNIVTANPDLVAIFANHDQATLGAVSAIQDLGLTDKIVICSFDGNPQIIDLLKSGDVLVCGAQQAKKMGREAVNALTSHFAGEEVEKEISVPSFLLTADNVDEYADVIENDICGLE